MTLGDEDVRDLLRLLDGLPFTELDLQTERFRLVLRRAADGWTRQLQVTSAPEVQDGPPQPAAEDPGADEGTAAEPVDDGFAAVRAPLVGTFYRAPRPGAEPFVEVGSVVDADSVVGIVETMKLMNSVEAGVRGRVVEIVAADAQMVQQDAVLMRIEPDAS